ncbi:hypothetical protein PQX77_009074 [Marasmius sp. AFHP31]|nr:hypothetical protein PQX77_009074 [Marasmius sp. AFHP31]
MLSWFFHKARNFQITGGSFNHVQGDQHNNNYTTTIVQAKEEEPSEFDEYFKVKLGGIFKLRDVGSSAYPRRWDDGRREWWEEGKPRSDKTIFMARVLEQPGMVFTMLQYSGPDAHRAFLEDFRMLSSTLTSNVSQTYGYSKSKIPSLILYNDLAPASQLEGKLGFWGSVYLCSVAAQLGCKSGDELWIDNGRGIFCRGPAFGMGYMVGRHFGELDVPLTADLLQIDVLLRFLASLKSWKVDRDIILFPSPSSWVDGPVQVSQPTVISKLKSAQKWVDQCNGNAKDTWKSQAWRIFHNRGITLEDDLSIYYLVYPYAMLSSFIKPSEAQLKRQWSRPVEPSEAQLNQQSQQPIFLFVRPPPSNPINRNTTSLHHWSFHKDGCSPLSPDTCYSLGLPTKLRYYSRNSANSWSNEDYQRIHQYQLLRGFDPSTTDFARHLGYDDNLFQSVNDSDRFEIHREYPPESRPSASAFDILGEFEDLAPVEQATTSEISGTRLGSTSFWSPVFLPSATEVSSEVVTVVDAPDVDVDWHLV